MTYTYIKRTESLEAMAARAIGEGAVFAENYALSGPIPANLYRRVLPQTLSRLECGDVFDERDDGCIKAMGDVLVDTANALCPGYGNRVLNICTHDDFLIDKNLEELRWMILRWQSFCLVRNQVRARMAARRVLNTMGETY
tara:strand:- start:13749 stop:14171 length:423 start_codon:yes stop_codon:yes gene_type:complete